MLFYYFVVLHIFTHLDVNFYSRECESNIMIGISMTAEVIYSD